MSTNIERVGQLKLLSEMPSGLIYPRTKSFHKLSVLKEGSQLQLVFFNGLSGEIQSRLDLNDPLHLVSPYTQAMMLGLVWDAHPQKIYIIGLGGGRVPMVLRNYFPDVQIDCTETDQNVVRVAQRFFGLALDAKLRVFPQDGRQFLQQLDPAARYDIIMVDAFDGTGSSPFLLSTNEFYEECAQHLVDDGLIIVNLLSGDRQYSDKVRTFNRSFGSTWMVSTDEWGGSVLFGARNNLLSKEDIVEKARQLEDAQTFSFRLSELARQIVSREEIEEFIIASKAKTLRDGDPPEPVRLPEAYFKGVGRKDLCPCGSGKKYKKCHGKP